MSRKHAGYSYFTIYRNHSVWINDNALALAHTYAATKGEGETPVFTVFAGSFDGIRERLDEVHAASQSPAL